MPWMIGIDEAGYGPNLGPLVQAAVALWIPDGDSAGWKTLRRVVRRCGVKADHRLLIDDSKAVYSRYGLEVLERGVLASLRLMEATVGDVLRRATVAGEGIGDILACEAWYDPSQATPMVATSEDVHSAFSTLAAGVPDEVGVGWFGDAIIVPTPRFNQIWDEHGSKAIVLSLGLTELIPAALDGLRHDGEPVVVQCDKHGGRNFYAAMLQEVFPNGWIVTERESAEESRYRVELLDRPVTVIFRPRADAESVAVALASMFCKYLREVCMLQFNRFWGKHVPGIRPTAGYPGDAKRFFDEIRPAMAKLGLTDDQVWRKR
jgi:ribonuclease HII